ncbi:hypothetical protein MRB53_006707 [Persea americana]|uniref:Uncharacterized protein n=1 Tax=Persea americana TaxID=3435 RepID=A0ACC2MH83_PERAE|nr:hypothetical protein MRB53_006707 [Persea americana]
MDGTQVIAGGQKEIREISGLGTDCRLGELTALTPDSSKTGKVEEEAKVAERETHVLAVRLREEIDEWVFRMLRWRGHMRKTGSAQGGDLPRMGSAQGGGGGRRRRVF